MSDHRHHPVWHIGQQVLLRDGVEPWTIHSLYVDRIRYVRLRQPVGDGRFTHLRVRDDVLRRHQEAIERDAERGDHDPRKAFGARLRELRVERDLTHHELARLARVNWSMLGRIERIAAGLGVHPRDFFA